MRKEICSVGNQDNQTALNLGKASDVCKLEEQSGTHANDHANKHTTKEDEQENANSFKEADESIVASLALVVLLRRLENDNGNGIVEDRLAKDDGVQLGIDFVGVEDGQDGHRISRRQCCANGDGIDKGHVQRSRQQTKEPQYQSNHHSRQKSARKGKCQDGPDVSEEVGLV